MIFAFMRWQRLHFAIGIIGTAAYGRIEDAAIYAAVASCPRGCRNTDVLAFSTRARVLCTD